MFQKYWISELEWNIQYPKCIIKHVKVSGCLCVRNLVGCVCEPRVGDTVEEQWYIYNIL